MVQKFAIVQEYIGELLEKEFFLKKTFFFLHKNKNDYGINSHLIVICIVSSPDWRPNLLVDQFLVRTVAFLVLLPIDFVTRRNSHLSRQINQLGTGQIVWFSGNETKMQTIDFIKKKKVEKDWNLFEVLQFNLWSLLTKNRLFLLSIGLHWTNVESNGPLEAATCWQVRICGNESDCSSPIR